MFKGERIFNITLLCGGLAFFAHLFVQASRYKITNGFWMPGILLVGIIFLSGKNLLQQIKSSNSGNLEEQREEIALKRLIGVVVSSFIYTFAMNYVGFIFSTPFYLASVLSFLNIKKFRSLTLIPLGFTMILFIVFIQILKISLPRGMGPFLYFSRIFY